MENKYSLMSTSRVDETVGVMFSMKRTRDVECVLQVEQRLGHDLALGGVQGAGHSPLGAVHGAAQVADAHADLHVAVVPGQRNHQVRRLQAFAVHLQVSANAINTDKYRLRHNTKNV